MAATNGRQVLTVGADGYSIRDVVDAAAFRGELQPAWEEFLRVRACERRAEEEGREADEEAIDAAMQAFRYDHDLITAEETERWLAERDLELSDFGDFFARHYWAESMLEEVKTEPVSYLEAGAELRTKFLHDLLLSGEFGRMATGLSWRLAAAVDAGKPGVELVAAERKQFAARIHPLSLSDWCTRTERDESWIDRMSQLEAGYRIACENALSSKTRQRALSTLRLQLTMLDLEVLEFDSLDAAREAHFCVRG